MNRFIPFFLAIAVNCSLGHAVVAQSARGSDRSANPSPNRSERFLDRLGQSLVGDRQSNNGQATTPPATRAGSNAPSQTSRNLQTVSAWGANLRVVQGGWIVVDLIPQSPAAAAGLRVNDRIVAVNGRNVASVDALRQAMALNQQSAQLRVVRGGRQGSLTIRNDGDPAAAGVPRHEPLPDGAPGYWPLHYSSPAPPTSRSASGITDPRQSSSAGPLHNSAATSQSPQADMILQRPDQWEEIIAGYDRQVRQLTEIIEQQQQVIQQLDREIRRLQNLPAPHADDGPSLTPPQSGRR